MLGTTLVDAGFESAAAGTYAGLGLLECTTRFISYDKNTTQVTRTARPVPPILSAMGTVTGYEIHMGTTEPGTSCREALEGDGLASDDGLVFGTYMHGLFQNPAAVNALLSYLHEKKGLAFSPVAAAEDPYEALADVFEEHVDMDAVAALLGS
jgi:adenosylcobyric acid synthase